MTTQIKSIGVIGTGPISIIETTIRPSTQTIRKIYYPRLPNNAVPILTIVEPSAIAAFKSPLIPNEKVSKL